MTIFNKVRVQDPKSVANDIVSGIVSGTAGSGSHTPLQLPSIPSSESAGGKH